MATDAFPFTTKRLEALARPKKGRARYRDAGTRGLGLVVTETGHKSFFWMRKVRDYPERKTLGVFPELSVDSARDAASELNSKLARWKASGFTGPNPFERPVSRTFGEIADLYIEGHLKVRAKDPTRATKEAKAKVENHLAGWRTRNQDNIRRSDVVEIHQRVKSKSGLYAANHLLQFVRAVINWAITSELWHGQNPAAKVKLFPEEKRRRFLVAPEIAALREALNDPRTSRDLRDYVLLALLCGARKSDVLSMRWEDIQLDRATWLVPQPKNAEPYYVPLTGGAVDILRKRKALTNGSPFVFPSTGRIRAASQHRSDLKKEWAELLKRAGITDLRQHDLRRTLGSWQAAGGASLLVVGKSLGHKSLAATAVYSQLSLAPIRASVEAATQAMFQAAEAERPEPKLLVAEPRKPGAVTTGAVPRNAVKRA